MSVLYLQLDVAMVGVIEPPLRVRDVEVTISLTVFPFLPVRVNSAAALLVGETVAVEERYIVPNARLLTPVSEIGTDCA